MEMIYSEWFKLIVIFCLALGIFIVYRDYRTHNENKEQKELEKTREFLSEFGTPCRLAGLTDIEYEDMLIRIEERRLKRYGK